jgi:hypothetical protein
VCVELEPDCAVAFEEIVLALRQLGGEHAPTRGIEVFLRHDGFPVDIRHNAKIGYEALAAWATKRVKS